jgi:dTDP-4-dehydrorhamnose reductase
VTWFEFARAILHDRDVRVMPIATEDYPTPARRPRYSVLDCRRIADVFGVAQPDWRVSLQAVCRDLAAG